MGPQWAGEAGRAPLARFAGRAVVLAALGTGLWLGGQATATAEELTPPSTAAGMASSAADAVATPGVEQLVTTPSAVAPSGGRADAPVVPLVPSVHSSVARVTDLVDPIVQAAEPEVAAPLRNVAAPVVAAVEQAIEPLTEAMPLTGARNSELAPVAGVLDPLLGAGPMTTQDRPDTDTHGPNEVVQGPAAGPAGSGRVLAPAGDDVVTVAGMGGAGGGPAPVRPPTPVNGGPVRAAGSGAHPFEQSPADLPAAVPAMVTAALAATDDARDAAGDIASDPSFSPD